jgi:hypothetical protein
MGMKAILIAAVLVCAAALPTVATAQPDETEKRAAKAQCKAERGKSKATREAFRAKYHDFNRCARRIAEEEEAETGAAHQNAAKDCKDERADDPAAFADKYGTNSNAKNAYGKCVSRTAKAKKEDMDAGDRRRVSAFKNAAKACAAKREKVGRDAFAERYGTNPNKRNAFGKCVSATAHETTPA